MYNETFNPDDFESELENNSKGPIDVEFEFPTPKEGSSLDAMLRKYGFIIFKEWSKTTNQEVKKK